MFSRSPALTFSLHRIKYTFSCNFCAFKKAYSTEKLSLPSLFFKAQFKSYILCGETLSDEFSLLFSFFFLHLLYMSQIRPYCLVLISETLALYTYTFFFFFKLIYLFLAVLGLHFCARAFSSCGKRGPLFIAVRGPPHCRGLSCCGAQAPDAQAQ